MTIPFPRHRSASHLGRSPLAGPLRVLEENSRLDKATAAGDRVAGAVTADARVRDLLQGRRAGHAIHPALVEVPLGTWLSAALLDLLGDRGDRAAARRLTGVGVLAVVPAVLTGLAEYHEIGAREKRVGVVHAGTNAVAALLQLGSWACRRSGRDRLGRALGMAGVSVAGVGGYLGGHLSLARNVGTADPAFADDPADGTSTR